MLIPCMVLWRSHRVHEAKENTGIEVLCGLGKRTLSAHELEALEV